MKFAIFYTLTAESTRENTAALMELFAAKGAVQGTINHYVYADGGGGIVIADETSLEKIYENALAYAPWMDFKMQPIIGIEDAVPQIGAWLSD